MSGIVGPRLSTIPPTFFNEYSFEFDGSDDAIQVGALNTSLGISGAITISFWCKMPVGSTTVGPAPLGEDSTGGVTRNWGFICVYNSLIFQIWNADGTVKNCTSPANSQIQDNNWHHIVGTYDGTSNSGGIELFIDGSSVATATASSTGLRTSAQSMYIGAVGSSGNAFNWDGNIDEVSVWDSVKTISDVSAGGLPIDLDGKSNLVVWYRMGDNATYRDPQWLLPNNENKDKASNYSMSFDGANDYIDCGNISEIKNNTEMTLSFWAKIEDMTFRILFGQNLVAGNDIFQMYLWGATPILYMWIKNGGTGTVSYVDNATLTSLISVGVWNHFTLVFNGSLSNADRCKLFINGGGDAITNRGTMPTSFPNSDEPFLIGRGTNGYFQGNIDNVAVWNSDQSVNVSTIYNGGVPSDLSSLNPINYYKMGENATFKSTQWLLPNNENKDKFSNYSMSFDGTNDVMSARGPSYPWWSYLTGKGACTVSVWIKASVGTNYMRFLEKNGVIALVQNGTTNQIRYSVYTSSGQVAVNGNMGTLDNTWIHSTMIYNGTDFKVYENGSLLSTTPHTGTIVGNPQYLYFGDYGSGGYALGGNLGDIAIFDTAKSISDLWDGSGRPTDLTSESGLVGYWLMGDDATFTTSWSITDKTGNSEATSSNMDINDRVGDAPGSSGNTVSYNMDINDRVGDAPNSQNNILSANIPLSGRTTDVPT